MTQVYALSTPWAHFDLEAEAPGIGRRRLDVDDVVRVPVGNPVFLTVPEGTEISLSGHRMGAEPESVSYTLGPARYQLCIASVGTRPDENILTIRVGDNVVGQVAIDGHFSRPGWSGAREGGAPTDRWVERLDQFLLGLVDLIRVADDQSLAHYQSRWDRLSAAWAKRELSLSEPPMSLIVRHAEAFHRLLAELAAHPRRILRRTRAQISVDRVQQLDVSCIRWLSRQPGETVYERAGPRQRILAVQRYEDLDTLENRVVRDFAYHSAGVARAYTQRYERLRHSLRWQRVKRYGADCTQIAHQMFERGIMRPQLPIVPNYVLLREPRYNRLWIAYNELLRRLDEEDECWRWQHRLWTDFCRLMLQIALRQHNQVEIVAESPLRLSAEQGRGRWSQIDVQSGVFLVETNTGKRAVVSVLWDTSVQHPKLATWMAGLGVATVLHVQSLDAESPREAAILIWPVHFFAQQSPSLSRIVRSAMRALATCVKKVKLENDLVVSARGLVVMSDAGQLLDDADERDTRTTNVIGVRFKTSMEELNHSIETIGRAVLLLIDELLDEGHP